MAPRPGGHPRPAEGSSLPALLLFSCCVLVLGSVNVDGGDRVNVLAKQLSELGSQMQAKHRTLTLLEELRVGILSGERIDLPSAQRQHLERGSTAISEVSYDARHRPVSTNVTQHFQHLLTVAGDVEVLFQAFMPLKRPSSSGAKTSGPSALLVVIDVASRFLVFDPDAGGSPLLGPIDLGHEGKAIVHLATSSTQESHLVLTANDAGEVRVHSLRVVARRETHQTPTKVAEEAEANETGAAANTSSPPPATAARGAAAVLNVTANLSCIFWLPEELSTGSEVPRLTTLLPLERSERTYFVTGDTLGGIAVFHSNGTLKGRVRVTEDPGGVRGLLKGQSQMVLFWSSHSFGSFSASQVDIQSAPCSGWNSPVYDVVLDPSYQSSRVVIALQDGDVIVFSTTRGKSKACDLTMKFPHVSGVPFKLQVFRGHVVALASPPETTERRNDLREFYFFNLAAMDNGYGAAPSRTVSVQAAFKPRQPTHFVIVGDRMKPRMAILFEGSKGIEMYGLSLKLPAAVQAIISKLPEEDEEATWSSRLWGWFPKVAIFGTALVGVVVWNWRKNRDLGDIDFNRDMFQDMKFKDGRQSAAQEVDEND